LPADTRPPDSYQNIINIDTRWSRRHPKTKWIQNNRNYFGLKRHNHLADKPVASQIDDHSGQNIVKRRHQRKEHQNQDQNQKQSYKSVLETEIVLNSGPLISSFS